ncbi:hypothetical protein SLE2022_176630 [Rubroshorea leprosula]
MASISVSSAPFLCTATLPSQSQVTSQRRLVIANAAKVEESVKLSFEAKKECSSNGRRDLMFAAAAAAVCTVAGVAMAGEPKPGTGEAKKLYAPVCVTMPTAKICHK